MLKAKGKYIERELVKNKKKNKIKLCFCVSYILSAFPFSTSIISRDLKSTRL